MTYSKNYPKTYAVLKEKYYDGMPDQCAEGLFSFIMKDNIPPTIQQREENLLYATTEVNQPMWSLCEDLLNGHYETNLIHSNKDSFSITVGGTAFKVNTLYHMAVDTLISPDICDNNVEKGLLVSCIYNMVGYELCTVPRQNILKYYKDKGET